MNGVGTKSRPDEAPARDAEAPLESIASEPSAIVGYLASVAMTAIATAMAIGIDSQVTIPNLSLIFVLPVIMSAVAFDLGPSICAAILGALAYNFFLTEPRYSLAVDDPAYIWAIGLLFVVGLIASTVAFTARRRATEATRLRRQLTVLRRYGCDVVAADTREAIVSITSQAVAALFEVPVVLLLVADGSIISSKQVGGAELSQAELDAAQSALATRTAVRAAAYPNLASRFDFWPVVTASGPSAIIGIAFDEDDRPSAPGTTVDIVASVLAPVLERQSSR